MKKLIFISITLLFGLNIHAEDAASLSEKAEQAYKNKEYAAATEIYESMQTEDKLSADVCYNLGNCYYRQNQIAKAILYYERALLIEPGMTDARENLIIANSKKQDKIDEVGEFFLTRWLNKLANIASSDSWAVTSIVCFVLALVFVLGYLFLKNLLFRKIGFFGAIVLALVFVMSVFFSNRQKQRLINREYAIVMSPSVTVKSTPDDNGTSLFVIHEGTKVKIQSVLDNWIEVKLSNGSVGWMLYSDVERI
ncbi:MAG: tetratricopeptide repeat protein [Paludibacteraceae bacterium]|nr:tetratricopeptide repeat protein [Paludibacteraceae bacterium]